MKTNLPIHNDKKLAVTYRVEAGCLGPNGVNFIVEFCIYAQSQLQLLNSDYINWNIVYREDKTLPEIEFGLINKIIDEKKAEKYLSVFGKTLDDFEGDLSDHITNFVSHFMTNKY